MRLPPSTEILDRPARRSQRTLTMAPTGGEIDALARGTNTGITALVAPSGRVVARFPTGQRAAWVVDVPLRGDVTPYTRLGDLFAWASVGVTLLLVAGQGVRQATGA